MSGVFDPGLQPERTALAWRRTGLALLTGSLVATRILPEVLGVWAVGVGVLGVLASGALLIAVQRRYHGHHTRLTTEGDRAPIAGGRLIAATAAFTMVAGVVTAVLFVALAARGGSL